MHFIIYNTHPRSCLACILLHNLIEKYIPIDYVVPQDYEDEEGEEGDNGEEDNDDTHEEVEYITHIESSDAWTTFRNTFAQTMFNNWRVRSNRNG